MDLQGLPHLHAADGFRGGQVIYAAYFALGYFSAIALLKLYLLMHLIPTSV